MNKRFIKVVKPKDVNLPLAKGGLDRFGLPCFLGAQHLGPDEVRVDGLLSRIGGADLQHERVTRRPRQRGQALDGAPRLQGEVGAVQLGQGLLDQRHPQLLPLSLQPEGRNSESRPQDAAPRDQTGLRWENYGAFEHRFHKRSNHFK